MTPKQLKDLAEILEKKAYTQEITKPANLNEGMRNFIQMVINEIESGNIREGLLKLFDLKNDIGGNYICVSGSW